MNKMNAQKLAYAGMAMIVLVIGIIVIGGGIKETSGAANGTKDVVVTNSAGSAASTTLNSPAYVTAFNRPATTSSVASGNASTSVYYIQPITQLAFGGLAQYNNGTSTLLTLTNIQSDEMIALNVMAQASSSVALTPANTILTILPQVSNNCVDWSGLDVGSLSIPTYGINVASQSHVLSVNNASGTAIAFNFRDGELNFMPQITIPNPIGTCMRFRVSSNGTTSVYMEAIEVRRF